MGGVSDKFNALTFEVRNICVGVMIDTEIRALEREKLRLRSNYNRSRKEINEKIKFMRRELERDYP